MTTANDIRAAFLSYFGKHGHAVLPSSPLVPHNDPTLMFTNAGMVQFKDIFTGKETPQAPRAATSQKCVRAGGKHNDLDNVGYTARHHTFFEMLGNFSFGDYFKAEAIPFAWELLTKEFALPKDRLSVTVYHTDDEAFDLWKKITGFADEKILRVPTKDNFWAMGDTGPCGPCSEIFYDHGEGIEGKWALDAQGHDQFGERFVEIWNLVFMQFEQHAGGSQTELPKPSIDTGMGLERISAVLQGVHDNYSIDLFKSLILASEELTSTKAEGKRAASHKIIADHLRSSCFLMADGVLPSNEGRGYVLRRIMRRAMRHAHLLGAKEPLMHRLVPALISQMGTAYPELERARALMTENLRAEEERFRATLERGLSLLEEESDALSKGDQLSGDVAFKLYDTYGFPLDLTETILRDQGIGVDMAGFNAAMAGQKARARAAWKGSGSEATQKIWFDIKERIGATEFLGYTQDSAAGEIRAIVSGDREVTAAESGEAWIVTSQTPFYGESGGQCGDSGIIRKDGAIVAKVLDTQKPLENFHVHKVILQAPIQCGDAVTLTIDDSRREKIRANHSATHLLHAALREVLGEHVTQKGSYVGHDKLRFDISHGQGMTAEEIAAVERRVNHFIWQNSEVSTKLMQPEAAIEAGAMALFGEKYGDEVRVLTMGVDTSSLRDAVCDEAIQTSVRPHAADRSAKACAATERQQKPSSPYSVELCGGTHVARTGDIGLFKITSEGAVAAGIRRIEAVTREDAFSYLKEQETTLRALGNTLKVGAAELPERIDSLLAERKKLEKELSDAKRKLAMGGGGSGGALEKESIGDITFAAKLFDDVPPKELRPLAESFLKQLGEGVMMVASGLDGKASLVVAVSRGLAETIDAVELVRTAAEAVGGKGGGGRPEMAQAGGPDGSKLEAAAEAVRQYLKYRADAAA